MRANSRFREDLSTESQPFKYPVADATNGPTIGRSARRLGSSAGRGRCHGGKERPRWHNGSAGRGFQWET